MLSPSESALCPWDSPGKNTGVGCHFLLQGSSRPRDRIHVSGVTWHWEADSLPLSHLGNSALSTVRIDLKNSLPCWVKRIKWAICKCYLELYLAYSKYSNAPWLSSAPNLKNPMNICHKHEPSESMVVSLDCFWSFLKIFHRVLGNTVSIIT